MQNDPSRNDPKQIWQNQPTEPSTMTLQLIRGKVRELHTRTRRELVQHIAFPFFAIGMCGVLIAQRHDSVQWAIYTLAIVWALAGQYMLNRGMWSPAMPGDAALSTGLQFYRQEVERQRYLHHRVLQWSFGPVVLAFAAFVLPTMRDGIKAQGLYPNAIPFFVLLLLWVGGVIYIRMRTRRELDQELEQLNAIERENK